MSKSALIIDDEPDIRSLAAMTLERIGFETHTAANLDEARNLLATYDFDVCLTDMRLPDGNGAEFVSEIHAMKPMLPVAVITAHGNTEAAVMAMKNGAFDFVSKPLDIKQLRALVLQAAALNSTEPASDLDTDSRHQDSAERDESASRQSITENQSQLLSEATTDDKNVAFITGSNTVTINERKASVDAGGLEALSGRSEKPFGTSTDNPCDQIELVGSSRLIGRSKPMQQLRSMIKKVARTNAPVWITGESGTGKELIARLIHDNGPRRQHPFVAINCGAIPGELMESELFGHKKGSFTGAVSDKEGLFRSAQGGTLFLDEVAELPLHMQVKLLRAVQERSIRPVGGDTEFPIDARILSASHADLGIEVETGRFRHDLYYRLNVISIRSPNLRDRGDDISDIATAVLQKIQRDSSPEQMKNLGQSAHQALTEYHFPGNVRELENILERAIAMADKPLIEADDLSLQIRPDSVESPSSSMSRTDGQAATDSLKSSQSNEYQRILKALEQTRWNRKLAAEQLGLTYRQLRYRIQQLGIDQGI